MWQGSTIHTEKGRSLQNLETTFQETSAFESAEPMTVRLRGVMVAKNRDGVLRGANDLVVVTKTQFGNEPPVQRLHYLERDVEPGWEDDFFHDVVLSTRDLVDERLTLRIQVYDADGVKQSLAKSIGDLASKTAVTFPVLVPYAGLVGLGAQVLLDLVDNIDDHDRIIDDRLTLEMADPGTGHKLLQPGYFVCFAQEASGEYELGGDLRVATSDGSRYERDYAVLEVAREYHDHRELERNHKAAKLVSELNGKGQSTTAPLEFLEETLDTYTKFRKLQRVKELQSKDELTDAERNLLEDLRSDEELAPYLPAE
jgi:hypothetical protein